MKAWACCMKTNSPLSRHVRNSLGLNRASSTLCNMPLQLATRPLNYSSGLPGLFHSSVPPALFHLSDRRKSQPLHPVMEKPPKPWTACSWFSVQMFKWKLECQMSLPSLPLPSNQPWLQQAYVRCVPILRFQGSFPPCKHAYSNETVYNKIKGKLQILPLMIFLCIYDYWFTSIHQQNV